jgi:hypothetical protein
MVAFQFTVGKAFLEYNWHRITVPKSQVPYRALEARGLSQKNVTIIFPRGERFEGQLHYGPNSGFGEYYQLQFRGDDRTLPAYIKCHDQLLITLQRVGTRTHAVLEYRE